VRIMAIIAVLAAIAIIFHVVWLGQLAFLFIFGCAIFGVGEAVVDLANGTSDLTAEGRRRNFIRHLESNPNLNPCYYNLRRRGKSHEECLLRGEPPIRPDDYYERKIERAMKEFPNV
jgi:hypothetical protein